MNTFQIAALIRIKAHFIGLCHIIVSQCTVQNTLKTRPLFQFAFFFHGYPIFLPLCFRPQRTPLSPFLHIADNFYRKIVLIRCCLNKKTEVQTAKKGEKFSDSCLEQRHRGTCNIEQADTKIRNGAVVIPREGTFVILLAPE
jgi:hypothetical protein